MLALDLWNKLKVIEHLFALLDKVALPPVISDHLGQLGVVRFYRIIDLP